MDYPMETELIPGEYYPIRMKVLIAGEQVEIEFREPGSYIVDIHINQ
jgi:hypothetical protein